MDSRTIPDLCEHKGLHEGKDLLPTRVQIVIHAEHLLEGTSLVAVALDDPPFVSIHQIAVEVEHRGEELKTLLATQLWNAVIRVWRVPQKLPGVHIGFYDGSTDPSLLSLCIRELRNSRTALITEWTISGDQGERGIRSGRSDGRECEASTMRRSVSRSTRRTSQGI